MGEVAVTINGRNYAVACDDGQEDHVARLASYIDKRVAELAETVGQVGDARLLVMAGLLVADELSEVYNELELHRSSAKEEREKVKAFEENNATLAPAVEALATRVEAIAARLENG